MQTIETTVIVRPDGGVTLHLPSNVPPGEHRVMVLIDVPPAAPAPGLDMLLDFPQHDFGPWPADLSLRWEDMYADDGR